MSSEKLIVGIEGASLAGKTTLVRELHKQYGFLMIPEYMDLAKRNHLVLPPFPPSSREIDKQTIDMLLMLEEIRAKIIQQEGNQRVVLLDRTILSLLCFREVLGSTCPDIPFSTEHCYKEIARRASSNKDIVLPHLIVHIQTVGQSEHQTRLEREPPFSVECLTRHEIAVQMDQWYLSVLSKYPEKHSLTLEEGCEPLQLASIVAKFIMTHNQTPHSHLTHPLNIVLNTDHL